MEFFRYPYYSNIMGKGGSRRETATWLIDDRKQNVFGKSAVMREDFYDIKSQPMITLEAFYGKKATLVKKCIVLFSKVIYDHVLHTFSCEQIARIGACNGDIPIWSFQHQGEKVAFYLSPMGSALAGGTIAEANHLTGANQFIMFGSCGSLDHTKTDGKFILPVEAYRGEGMSYYYAPPGDYIQVSQAQTLERIFRTLQIPYICGRVWTTDSILRETVNLVEQRKKEGCLAVEMELAGVQAVCDFYGWKVYDFLATGDVLAENHYDMTGLNDANHNLNKFEIALAICERI
ncbi:MAG: nucleoside phosphorylase [Peptoniphilaceae bacterium]|nr:nucleoside phosphorylase [Peptoniphilaceae bacterium]MDY3075630.1 nucleoside phosphorylase [Peptoniphilaceae bacterium]